MTKKSDEVKELVPNIRWNKKWDIRTEYGITGKEKDVHPAKYKTVLEYYDPELEDWLTVPTVETVPEPTYSWRDWYAW